MLHNITAITVYICIITNNILIIYKQMGNYISNFNTTAEFAAFSATTEFKRPHVSLTKDSGEVHYFEYDYSQDYFTMVVTVGGNIKFSGSTTSNRLSYSTDNGENWSAVTSADTISVAAGDKILWKGTPTPQKIKVLVGSVALLMLDTL